VGSLYYELSHDTLVQPILESHEERKARRNWVTVPILLLVSIFIAVFAASRISKNIHLQELYKEAMKLKNKGEYGAAIHYYSRILEIDEKHAAPYVELGELRERLKHTVRAMDIYEKAIRKGIKSEVIHHRLGRLHALDKRLEKAAAHYEKAIVINPGRAIYHAELGDIHGGRNEFAAAEKSYREALALDKKDVSAYKGLLALYIKHDSLDDAINIFRKALGRDTDFVYTIVRDIALQYKKDGRFGDLERLYYITSQRHFHSGNSIFQKKFGNLFAELNEYQKTIKYYEGALYPGYKDASTYRGLAVAYVNVGEPGKAIECYEKAVKADPANVRIFGDIAVEMKNRGMTRELKRFYQTASAVEFDLAVHYEKLGTAFYYLEEYDRAMENYQKALALDNKNISVYKGLAVVHICRGNPGGAIDIYRQAVEISVNFAGIYRDIAWTMNQKKRVDRGEELLQIASDVYSKKASYYDKLGRDFKRLKNYDRAVAAYKKALNLDDKHASVYTGLAVAYIKGGSPDKALEVYRDALKADPEFADICEDIARAFGKELAEEREKFLQVALEVDSKEASYFEKLGVYLSGLEMYDMAVEAYKKASVLNDMNASTYAMLALLYIEKGNPEEALELFRKAVKKIRFGLTDVFTTIAHTMSEKKMSVEREKLLEIASGADSQEASLYGVLAFYYYMYKDIAKAVEFYEKALELDDSDTDVYDNLVNLYIQRGQVSKAVDLYLEGVKNRSRFAYHYGKIAAELKKKNMKDELEMILHAASGIDSRQAWFYARLGRDFNELKKYDRAIEFYKKALMLDDKSIDSYVGLSVVYLDMGNPAKAVDIFLGTVKTGVNYAGILRGIADVMKKKNMKEELGMLLRAASGVDSKKASYYEVLGATFSSSGEYDGAVEAYKKALSFDDKKTAIYRALARLHIKWGHADKAIIVYRNAIKAYPSLAFIYKDIAKELMQKKMTAEAEKLLQIAADVGPEMSWRYYEGIGLSILSSGKYDRAIELFGKVLQTNPKSDKAYFYIGFALGRKGNYEEAAKNYKQALRLNPRRIDVKTNLAEIELIRGRFSNAFDLANEVLKNTRSRIKEKLPMRFVSIVSLFFQEEKAKAYEELGKIIPLYRSADGTRHWNYEIAKKFLNENKKLKEDETKLLFDLIDILEFDGRAEEAKLKAFEKAVKKSASSTVKQ
jgi:tetratricopeptide (TPR) repeat protein